MGSLCELVCLDVICITGIVDALSIAVVAIILNAFVTAVTEAVSLQHGLCFVWSLSKHNLLHE